MEETRGDLHNLSSKIAEAVRRAHGHKLHPLNLDTILGDHLVISALPCGEAVGRLGQEVAGSAAASVGSVADCHMRAAELML